MTVRSRRVVRAVAELRFKLEMSREQSAALWSTLARLGGPRACRTCDYGNDPGCRHEQRAERVCTAPVGNFDCAAVPCLGACSTPAGHLASKVTAPDTSQPSGQDGDAYRAKS